MNKTVGVIGAGTMGNGIAQVFASAGFQVIMRDVNEQAVSKGMHTIEKSLDRFLSKEKISEYDKAQTLARITGVTDIASLSDADIVVEAATENEALKLKIFAELGTACKPDAILASNTSSISLTKIAGVTQYPERVIGMHFMNPVPLMPLLEIIRALQTDDATHQQAETIAKKLGKTPVTVKDSAGFVSNRILMPMINEAIFTLHEGLASAEDVDAVMKLGMSHPIGPLALADLIGLDTCLSVMKVLHDGFDDSKYRPCPLLKQMVDAGRFGRKSGRGFFKY